MTAHTDHLPPSASGYRRGCRCVDCTAAQTRWSKLYRLRTKAGADGRPRIPVTVPVADVAAHLTALVDSGWSLTDVAAECGIHRQRLYALRACRSARRVHAGTAARIRAVQPLEPVLVDDVVVERLLAGGDWRALRATRAERIAAAERMPTVRAAEQRLALRAGRDFTRKGAAA